MLYLAAAGVGRLGIVDQDTVELSNLHRQIAHTEAGQGVHKAESAAAACRALNSSIEVHWLWDACALLCCNTGCTDSIGQAKHLHAICMPQQQQLSAKVCLNSAWMFTASCRLVVSCVLPEQHAEAVLASLCMLCSRSCSRMPPGWQVVAYTGGISPANALELLQPYDVVVDATDNAPTRYLLSDACCVARKPLVSGAAIGLDGQLTVYCHGPAGGAGTPHASSCRAQPWCHWKTWCFFRVGCMP